MYMFLRAVCDLPPNHGEQMPVETSGDMVHIVDCAYMHTVHEHIVLHTSMSGFHLLGAASPPNSLASPPKKRLTISLHHR